MKSFNQFKQNENKFTELISNAKAVWSTIIQKLDSLKKTAQSLVLPPHLVEQFKSKYQKLSFSELVSFMKNAMRPNSFESDLVQWYDQNIDNKNIQSLLVERNLNRSKKDIARDEEKEKANRIRTRYFILILILAFILTLFMNDPQAGIH